MRTLYIRIRRVYGRDTIYPACDDSRIFADMLGRKTLTERDMRHIRTLGYNIEVIRQEIAA